MVALPLRDRQFLESDHPDHELWVEDGFVCVVLPGFALPSGLVPAKSDLLLRLPPGYPDRNPDMFWFAESVTRADGRSIRAVGVPGTYGSRAWSRWSRHMVATEWRSADGLRGYLGYVRLCLFDAAKAAA